MPGRPGQGIHLPEKTTNLQENVLGELKIPPADTTSRVSMLFLINGPSGSLVAQTD